MEKLKIESMLAPDDVHKANNYVIKGGAIVSERKATEIVKRHGFHRPPRLGYEMVIETTAHRKTIIKHEGGKFIIRTWTSPSAPWFFLRRH